MRRSRNGLHPLIMAAAHRRTAERYWQLADAAERTGQIDRAREFVTLALDFDRRAIEATTALGRLAPPARIRRNVSRPAFRPDIDSFDA